MPPQDPYYGDGDIPMMDASAFGQMDPNLMLALMQSMAPQAAAAAPAIAPAEPLGGEGGSFTRPPSSPSLGDPDIFGLGSRMAGPAPTLAAAAPAPTTTSRGYDYRPHGAGDWMEILAPALLGIAGAAVGGGGGAAGAWSGYAKGEDDAIKRRMQQQALDQRTAVLAANERRYREMERQRDENNQRLRDATGSQLLDKVIKDAAQYNDPDMQAFALNQHAKELARYGFDVRKFAPQVSERAKTRLQGWAQKALDSAVKNIRDTQGSDKDLSPFFAPSSPDNPEANQYAVPVSGGKPKSLRELAILAGHVPEEYAKTLGFKKKAGLQLPADQQNLMNGEMAAFYAANPDKEPTPEDLSEMQARVTQNIARYRHIQTPEERAEATIFGRAPTSQPLPHVFPKQGGRAATDPSGAIDPPEEGQPTRAAMQEVNQVMAGAPTKEIPADVYGEEFLAASKIPENTKALIRAVAQGRAQIPGGFGGAGLRTEFLAAVSRYDPTFDTANPTARIAVRRAFTSGTEAKSVNALNTVMGHFDVLARAADALGNGNVRLGNWLINSITNQLGEPETNDYNVAAAAVAREATRVWRGTGGSVEDVKEYTQQLSSSNSPRQQYGAMADLAELVHSKLQALQDQYETGMGLTYAPPEPGMEVSSGSWLLRPWAYEAMANVYQRAGRRPPGPPSPDLLRQAPRTAPPLTAPPPAAAPAPTPQAGRPAIGPTREAAAALAAQPAAEAPMPRGGVSIPITPQSRQLGVQVNALSDQLQQAIRDRRSPAEVSALRRQLQSAVNKLEALGQ